MSASVAEWLECFVVTRGVTSSTPRQGGTFFFNYELIDTVFYELAFRTRKKAVQDRTQERVHHSV